MPANSRIRIIGKQVYAEESFHLEALLSLGEPLADFGEGRIRIRHPERSDRKPRKFVRLHRSAIVNIDHVREIHRDGRAEGWVLLSTGERVRMNRTGWQKLIVLNSI